MHHAAVMTGGLVHHPQHGRPTRPEEKDRPREPVVIRAVTIETQEVEPAAKEREP